MVTFHTFVFKTEREFDEGGEVDAHVVVEQYTLLVGYSIDIQLFDAAQYGALCGIRRLSLFETP